MPRFHPPAGPHASSNAGLGAPERSSSRPPGGGGGGHARARAGEGLTGGAPPFALQVIWDPTGYVSHVKGLTWAKAGLPATQRQLVLAEPEEEGGAEGAGARGAGAGGPAQAEARAAPAGPSAGEGDSHFGEWEVVLYRNDRALGRLRDPRVVGLQDALGQEIGTHERKLSTVLTELERTFGGSLEGCSTRLVFESWKPAGGAGSGPAGRAGAGASDAAEPAEQFDLPIDDGFHASTFKLSVFTKYPGRAREVVTCSFKGGEVHKAVYSFLDFYAQQQSYVRAHRAAAGGQPGTAPAADKSKTVLRNLVGGGEDGLIYSIMCKVKEGAYPSLCGIVLTVFKPLDPRPALQPEPEAGAEVEAPVSAGERGQQQGLLAEWLPKVAALRTANAAPNSNRPRGRARGKKKGKKKKPVRAAPEEAEEEAEGAAPAEPAPGEEEAGGPEAPPPDAAELAEPGTPEPGHLPEKRARSPTTPLANLDLAGRGEAPAGPEEVEEEAEAEAKDEAQAEEEEANAGWLPETAPISSWLAEEGEEEQQPRPARVAELATKPQAGARRGPGFSNFDAFCWHMAPVCRKEDSVLGAFLHFLEAAAFGLGVPFQPPRGRGRPRAPSTAYFAPSLSAVNLTVCTPAPGRAGQCLEASLDCVTFTETVPPFDRPTLVERARRLTSLLGRALSELAVAEVVLGSWYAVAWYPIYRVPEGPHTAAFLTYHLFPPCVPDASPRLLLPAVGVLSFNAFEDGWLDAGSSPDGARGLLGRLEHFQANAEAVVGDFPHHDFHYFRRRSLDAAQLRGRAGP